MLSSIRRLVALKPCASMTRDRLAAKQEPKVQTSEALRSAGLIGGSAASISSRMASS